MCVCLLVCLSAFYQPHDICPLCGAASEYSERAGAVAGGPACRAGKHALARARARMPYNFSTKKSLRWCLSKTKPYARWSEPTLVSSSSIYVPSHLRTSSHLATFRPICRRDVSRWGVPPANILPNLPTFWPICEHHLKAALLTNGFLFCDSVNCAMWSCELYYVVLSV